MTTIDNPAQRTMPETVTMLMLCTAHVTSATAYKLDRSDLEYPTYVKEEYGWIVPVLDEEYCTEVPADLGRCIDYAEKLGCKWIMFDRDVDRVSDLPEYQW